jgi:hydroxymethylglutaryl-CoA lyase
MTNPVKIIECPRDAMQGFSRFIPTDEKVDYINHLLRTGFHSIDAGSFVSPKAIPQMADTAEVFNRLHLSTYTGLLAIVANRRGAEQAVEFDQLDYLGYPFSISETFQQRNTNSSIEESFANVAYIRNLCGERAKELVLYVSMAFGNPYGDPWNVEVVEKYVKRLEGLDIKIISLADTTGMADAGSISYLFSGLTDAYPDVEFGAHFHTRPDNWREKVDAAYVAGCRRFDGAIRGFGGCPMADDHLVGNMPTENLLAYFDEKGIDTGIDKILFSEAMMRAEMIFR